MIPRTTWTLVAVATALFALIYFVERPLRENAHDTPSKQLLSNITVASVTSVYVRPAGESEIRFLPAG